MGVAAWEEGSGMLCNDRDPSKLCVSSVSVTELNQVSNTNYKRRLFLASERPEEREGARARQGCSAPFPKIETVPRSPLESLSSASIAVETGRKTPSALPEHNHPRRSHTETHSDGFAFR